MRNLKNASRVGSKGKVEEANGIWMNQCYEKGERVKLPWWELSKSKSIHSSMDGFLGGATGPRLLITYAWT